MGFEVTIKNTATPALDAMAARSDKAAMLGLRRVAGIIQNMAVRQAQGIYKRPIPTKTQVRKHHRSGREYKRVGGKGTKAWERTGNLLKAIEAEPVEGTGEITIRADVPYAKARHQLGVTSSATSGPFKGMSGWVPKNPALGIRRTNPWAAEAVEKTEPQIQPAFGAVYTRALKKGD